MIVGIVLLLFTSIVIYIRQVSIGKRSSPIESIYKVPEEAQPIYDYVAACVRDKTKEAIIILGEQGGYIYPEEYGVLGDFIEPTDATGLQFSNHQNYVIPYWLFMKDKNACLNNCAYDSKQPLLKRSQKGTVDGSIESQIDVYLNENLDSCFDNFKEFKERGYQITVTETPDATTYITDGDVAVNLEIPITIRRGDSEVTIYKVTTHTQVDLKGMYELASEITQKETENALFEWQMITLISAYGGGSEDKLPPMSYFDFGLGDNSPAKKWQMDAVKQKLKTLMTSYTPILLVENTTNFYPPYIIEDSKFQDRIDPSTPTGPIQGANAILNSFRMPLSKEYPYSASFTYLPDWEPYINVRPNIGGVTITPSESGVTTDLLREIGIGLNKYEFKYDASYPVLVKITDPNAFNEEGYSFVFALEANIRNNEPLINNESLNTRRSIPTGTYACNQEQKVSGNITILVSDGNNSKAVEDADVFFNFGGESCYLGKTQLIDDYTAVVVGTLPKGIGKIQVSKEGYQTSMKLFGSTENKTQKIQIAIYPKYDKPIRFMLKNIDKKYLNGNPVGWDLNPTPYMPDESISAVLIFERLADKTSTSAHKKVALFNASQDDFNITLVPGTYTLKIITTDSTNITIPLECTKWSYGVPSGDYVLDNNYHNSTTQGYRRYCKLDRVINETNISLTTMYEFNISTGVHITPSELYGEQPLTIYGVYLNLQDVALENRTHEDLSELGKIQTYYFPRYFGQLYPR